MNGVKSHICGVQKKRLGHDLPVSVNDRKISPFQVDFIFTKLHIFRGNETLEKIFESTVYISF